MAEKLSNPKKADLNKDGELSSYEKKRGAAIEKAMDKSEGMSRAQQAAIAIAKMKKEEFAEMVKEVLAEREVVKKVVGPKGGSVAQAVSPEEERELEKAGAKVEPMEEDHHENPNDDSDMAKSQLYAIAKYSLELLQMIKDGDPLDAWVQAKITKASDYIDAVQHYLEGEEYLDANQEETEEELDEIKKAEFEKIKPGKELQLRGYGVVTVVANDGIVMKIKDSLDKVHTINLGQYNEKFLKEARKRGEKTVRTELDATIAKMKELAKRYKEGDKSIVPTLKDLTARKKALSAELEKIVAGIGAGQEYKGEVDESITENQDKITVE